MEIKSHGLPIDESVEDILGVLERETWRGKLPDVKMKWGKDQEEDFTAAYYGRRHGNTVVIYGRAYTVPPGKIGPREFFEEKASEKIRFEVSRITDKRSWVIGKYDILFGDHHKKLFFLILSRLEVAFGVKRAAWEVQELENVNSDHTEPVSSVAKPEKPTKPNPGSKLDIWFDWYHAMHANDFRCTLADIAKEVTYNAGYVRQLHARYAEERSLTRSNKRPDKN